ncbi:MAG: TolC family protein [bacterium]
MNLKKCGLIFLAIFMFSGFAGAQAPWTFQQCIDTALRRNININQVQLANETNKINLEQVKANRIPSFNASANEGLSLGTTINPTTNQYVTQAYHSTRFGINGNWSIFAGLQNANTIRQNMLNIQSGQFDIDKAKNDVILSITTGYLQVLFCREILETAKNQAGATAAQVDRTEKMYNAGKSPESDLLQIKSQLATDNLSIINAENQLDMAKVTLMQLMYIPITPDFDVVVPEMTEPDGIMVQTNEEIYQKALQVRPEIASAAIQTNSARLGIKISDGARWPSLNLSANTSTNYASSRKKGTSVNPENYPFYQQVWDNLGQSFSLGLSIPIYSNRSIKSRIDRAKISAMNAQLNEQLTQTQLRKSIEQTFVDLKGATKKYEASKEQIAAVSLVYTNSEKKFTVGVMSATDFLIQKNNYTQALSNLIQAKYDYIFKTKILDFYQGKAIQF